jgi:hypothetical protein
MYIYVVALIACTSFEGPFSDGFDGENTAGQEAELALAEKDAQRNHGGVVRSRVVR